MQNCIQSSCTIVYNLALDTLTDPYRIATPADFKFFTDSFNASTSSAESEMYGYGKYFLQTADLDMTGYPDYNGTVANGNQKCYFAGIYNGGGHTLRVDIDGTVQRSVFPYVYGTVCNLKIEGSITSETSAQPVRTLYGSIVNCIFQLDLSAKYANGLLYSNYGLVYNVFTAGTLSGEKPRAVCNNDSSTNYQNVFHYRTTSDGVLADAYGIQSNDPERIANAFNERVGDAFEEGRSALGGFDMEFVFENEGSLVFGTLRGDVNRDGSLDMDDAIYLLFHVNFPDDYPVRGKANFDGIGETDMDDAIYLLFHVNFSDAYPLH